MLPPILSINISNRLCPGTRHIVLAPRLFSTSKPLTMPPKNKYTNPKLRDEVKKDIQDSDKGGAPGQWSARKVDQLTFPPQRSNADPQQAQFMASEYKKRGGDYNTEKKDQDDTQKNLSKWGEEEWQTKEGSGNAKKADGTQQRYLPKKAWEEMDEQEKVETDQKKQDESKKGKQFVANTGRARSARKKANDEEAAEYEEKKDEEKDQANGKPAEDDDGEAAEEDGEEEVPKEKPKRGAKRKSTQSNGPSKKQKTNATDSKESKSSSSKSKTMGSKHDPATPPAKQASNDRLPKKGQKVTWKAMPGWVHGTVLEIAKKDGSTEGKSYKATKENPTIVLRAESGKVAAHKSKSVYFD